MKTIQLAVLAIAAMFLMMQPVYIAEQSQTAKSTATPIKHVIFLMMENHSFDNLFGTYPYTDNLSMRVGSRTVNPFLSASQLSSLKPVPSGTYSTADPAEGWIFYHLDWNSGKMDGFSEYSGPASSYYYNASQMAIEWDLAHEFSMGVGYFSSMLTDTVPNRLYSLAGYTPVIDDYGPPPYIPINNSIFGEMNHYGVSWSYYLLNPGNPSLMLPYFQGIQQSWSHVNSWNGFVGNVENNTLPSVSWVEPISGGAHGYSQHPSDSVFVGEQWLLYIVEKVMHSSEWNSTAIIITYDEGGGFYDSVPPPTTAGSQLGFRVPFIVISPYAKENYLSTTIMSHTSLIAFVDYNWGMLPLDKLVAYSNLPLDMFNFNKKYSDGNIVRPPVNLTGVSRFMPPSIEFSQSTPNGSIGAYFPLALQYNSSTLPYAESGNSSINMENATQYFVQAETAITPFYFLPAFLVGVFVAAMAVPVAVFEVRKFMYMKRKNK